MKRTKIITGAVILAFAVLFFIMSFSYGYYTRFGPGSGFFPLWINGGLIVLATLFIIESIREKPSTSAETWPKGKALANIIATIGSLVGASFNYVVSMWLGRPFLERWGRYFFVRPELLHKTDAFFARHGAVSTFTGRLIPGIRHLISIPAGLTRMNLGAFAFYTSLGAGLWSLVLTLFGYFLGGNEALIQQYQHHITVGVIAFVALVIGGYWWWNRRR